MFLGKKTVTIIMSILLAASVCFTGCGREETLSAETELSVSEEENVVTSTESEEENSALTEAPEDGNYLEVALNVYYNDNIANYYSNEAGKSVFITEEGTYTLSFDCSKDLSNDAINAGVKYLDNLTAVYLLDMGVAKKEQSPVKECKIKYESVSVDGTELTITQTEPKSAIKSSGVFDTNDPINGWDGSAVLEVSADDNHAANFTTITHPTKISVTFTLSDIVWGEETKEVETVSKENISEIESVYAGIDFTDVNSVEFVRYLGNGINLGNTMEAYGRTGFGTNASVNSYETCWGQPITTQEMIQGMKDCGFDTLRIPVAWTNMMAYESGDYTINTAYLDRVEKIVNFALDADMFVIVNDHWDGGWWAMFGSSNQDTVNKAWDIYTNMWTQIAERFKDYPDMLILESANEELGNSLNDNSKCADSGALSENGKYEMTNAINQKFVDIVRNSGGNNTDRFLLIAGYNTNIDNTCDNRFKMPSDTAKDKLLVSVHYYDPWNYCGDKSNVTEETLASYRWGIKDEYEYMNSQLAKMSKFTDAGYGVIIGEYGALPATIGAKTRALPNTIEYTENLLDVCDIYNFCPVLWSTGNSYDKKTCTMMTEELTELFTSRNYASEVAYGEGYLEAVKNNMAAALENAPDMWEGIETYEAGTPVAWIMWNGGAGTYSVGDKFNPADNTAGITANNVVIDGPGEYEVSLDFAGGNDGITFAALAVADGELLYPGMYIQIESITCDEKEVELTATPYTSSDDKKCTRVNLVNEWVNNLPEDARSLAGLQNASPVIFDKTKLVGIKNITIKFRIIIKK